MILTAGHSNHPYPRFSGLISSEGTTKIIDCRSTPFSKRVPAFNTRPLELSLKAIGIEYQWLGNELGGRPTNDSLYTASGKANYKKMADQKGYVTAVETVLLESRDKTILLLCSEEAPEKCHRALMVAETLAQKGAEILHLRADGQHQDHETLVTELKRKNKLTDRQDAIMAQAARVAYRRRPS